jgi:gentisate 1,2-dioxygenase
MAALFRAHSRGLDMESNDALMKAFFEKLGNVANYDPERDMPERLEVHSDEAHWIGENITHNPGRLGCLPSLPAKAIEVFLQEIPANSTTDLQRHTHETIHYVLQGEGHSEIGPRVVAWRTGSFVYTPVWVWHRHYNNGATEVKMLTIEASRLTDALALSRRESAGLVSYKEYMTRAEARRD